MIESNRKSSSNGISILLLSLPILLGNLLFSINSIMSSIWVGHFLDKDALSVLTISLPLMSIIVGIATGLTNGVSILIAQSYGANTKEKISLIINTAFTICFLVIPLFIILGILSSDFIVLILNTPPEIADLASHFLKITFLNMGFTCFFLLITAILRGFGMTLEPILFLILSVILNVFLEPCLISGIGIFPKMDLMGSAYATLISQGIISIIGYTVMARKYPQIKLNKHVPLLERDTLHEILKIGLPSVIQQCMISVGSGVIITIINTYGLVATSAFGLVSKIDSFALMPMYAVSTATTTITAQNFGAKKNNHTSSILKWSILLNTVFGIIITALVLLSSYHIMHAFTSENEIIQTGIGYLKFVASGYLIFSIMLSINGVINGLGRTKNTMIFSLFSFWVVRIPLAKLLSNIMGLNGIWIAILVSFVAVMSLNLLYYLFGSWRKSMHNT